MKDLSIFFKNEKNVKMVQQEYTISDRFKDSKGNIVKFVLEPLNPVHFNSLNEKHTTLKVNKDGSMLPTVNTEIITQELLVKCVKFPNLNDAELQNSYGVMGAKELATEMLTNEEYNLLTKILWDIHTKVKEISVEDIKKG